MLSAHLFLSGHLFLRKVSVLDGVLREVPGQEIGDAVDGMLSYAFQELAKIKLWFDAVQLRRADQ